MRPKASKYAIVILHNFIEAHSTTNEIRCEKAGAAIIFKDKSMALRLMEISLPKDKQAEWRK